VSRAVLCSGLLLLALCIAACPGGSDDTGPVLHLDGADITEQNFRTHVELYLAAESPEAREAICRFARGLLVDEAREWFEQTSGPPDGHSDGFLAPWTPVPGQTPDGESQTHGYNLIRQRCQELDLPSTSVEASSTPPTSPTTTGISALFR
jgi:hypothetical protein